MGSRKENMREWRRQADPSFPVAVKSRPSKPPPPRPSEPPPSRPTEPPVSSHMDPCAVPSEPPPLRYPEGVLKGHKGRKKRKNKKDLRVSFDLENTQERIVPQEEEEEVVECWEDLSDGEVWSAGAPEACDNFFNDDLGASVSVDSGAEPPSEVHDYEGFTYFGIRESDCTDEVDELLDAPESRPRGMENDMSPVYQGGGITDRELVEEQTSVSLDTELTDIQYPEELADMSFMEGFTEVSHSDEVSHTEGLTEVRCPDELNDVSFMSLGESRDELSCTEVAESKRPEQLTNITYLVELNDGSDNVESLTDVKNSEEMTDTCHEEGLTDVTFPEDLADMSYFEKLTNQRNSPEIPCLERVTDMSQLDELDNISRIEQLTDVSLSDELPYVTQSDELTDAKHLEEKQSERSHLGGPADPSHAELSDVPQLEALTDVSYPDEMDNFYAKPTTGSHAEQNCSEGLTIVSQPEKVIITLEEVNDDSDNEELSDMNKDKLITVNHDMVTERAQHTGSQEDTFFTVSDTNTPPCESLRETPGSDRERCSPSPSIEAEADTRTESVTGLTCEGEIELTTAPLASHPEEDEPKGDLEEDDDEWETDPSGDSEETSESTWGAAETESRPSAGERTTGDGCEEDSDCLIPSDDIEAVLALIEDQEKAMPYVSQTLAQDENHILASEPALREDRKGSEREASPQVTVGYECRDRKSTSHYASETESEGELVPCEDKCVGTADQSDEDLLNVSPAENVSHEGGIRQNIVNECQERDLSLDKSKQCTLAAPEVEEGSSPSPEIPELPEEGKCFGNSESGKEKDKINGKKIMKKKGKKNKREAKVEPLVSPVDVLERPKLVRGRGWKAKQGEINVKRVALQNLSFGNEVCESEVVEGTSNLLTETYTETALLTPTRCPLGTTVFTETPCTACSTVSGEFSEPDNLHDHCKCGEQQREDAGLVALVAEVKTCKEAPKPALGLASSLSPPVTVEVTGASDEEDHRVYDAASSTEDTNEFFIVKTQTVASPSHVLTEYVEDTESEEDMKIKDERVDNKVDVSFQGLPASTCDSTQTNKSSPGMAVQNESCIYIDAEDSGCIDTLNEQFDYDKSFPKVLGTQHLNVKYTYDSGTDTDSESSLESIEGEGETPDLEGSDMKANLDKQGHGDRLYTSGWGEIIYEGPCLCGDTEFTRERLAPPTVLESVSETGESGAEEELCVPAMRVSNTEDVATGDGDGTCQEATGSELPASNMGSNQEDQVSEGACSAKDIRMRINEIVGARLLRDRGRVESPCVGDENGSHEEQPGGREESPLPGSSPASSSGVQGSDEMSVSRSRSRSPSREKSVSPAWASGSAPECSLEPRQSPSLQQDKYECEALESLRALRFEGNIEATPEKSVPLDCSFRTFRDMYQINPIYLTDSDDHEDLNESDTVVPVSTSLEYDPERSITVTSWSSASDCSPDPPELRSSSPLHGTHATKKVPKVTKLLRETQAFVASVVQWLACLATNLRTLVRSRARASR
ncbi:hypothetical protein GWK47_012924 [Chionoecetes opilio]|uniref:Uncharacterized protein n=1 Tax=Chionoecetes opilio TaxID=41210 RepID=A0A8J4Y104_CHIOP|nr:hypothetical protein GWK47_012924 [Chionoecetes opilio]